MFQDYNISNELFQKEYLDEYVKFLQNHDSVKLFKSLNVERQKYDLVLQDLMISTRAKEI